MIALRRMRLDEEQMVLANWKMSLYDTRIETRWGRDLAARNFWCLANHVIDRISFPSCEIWMGTHPDDDTTPMCWVAIRRVPGLLIHEVVFLYARQSLRKDPELAATLETDFLGKLHEVRPLAKERRRLNLYLELDRTAP